MTEKIKPILVKISKLELMPEDYLALRFPDNYSREGILSIASDIRRLFPELRVLLFYDDVQIDVVHQENK